MEKKQQHGGLAVRLGLTSAALACTMNRPLRERPQDPMRLIVNLIYDDEYKGYVADVPELPGCMSPGKAVETALKNVKEAIALYIETAPRRKKRARSKPPLTTTVEV